MATVLLAWELGAGLGHLTVLRPVAQRLAENGHQVHLVARDLASVETVCGDLDFPRYQAPIKIDEMSSQREPTLFAHILHNCGFAHESELVGRIRAWDRLYQMIQPDMVILDHCPTALAAARGHGIKRVLIGTGFVSPPATNPLPTLRPWHALDQSEMETDENHTRTILNQSLSKCGKPTVAYLADLYGEVDLTLLTTFKELDHFGQRQGVRYWGAWPSFPGAAPQWPDGSGKKIFAYLKKSPGLTQLLKELKALRLPTIVYGGWVTERIVRDYGSHTLRLESTPLDLAQVAAQCDVAILNATHGATAAMLIGGAPMLQLPIFLEQRLLAERVVKLGAGRTADRKDVPQVMPNLRAMLESSTYASAAQRFAALYAQVDPTQQFDKMMDQIENLLPERLERPPVERKLTSA